MKDIYELGCTAGLLNYIDHETPRVYFVHAHAELEDFEAFCKALTKERDDEIERLREALRTIADGDTPREHAIVYRSDGVHSKHDKCKHGAWMYDGCEDCVAEYARAALGEGK